MKTQNSKDLKQQYIDIQNYLYRFRYLNRPQIQTLLNHKYFHRVIVWLNEMTEKRYIARDFNRKFAGEPAIYCLDTKSRKIMLGRDGIKNSLLKKAYYDKTRSRRFKNHNLLVVHIYLSLTELVKKTKAKLSFYTKTDLYKTKNLILPIPDAYFAIEEANKTIKRYFLDIFDPLVNPKWPHKRVMQYFSYYDSEYWQNSTDKSFPEIIMVCPDEDYKKDLEKFIKKMYERNQTDLSFYLSTWEEIKIKGMRREALFKISK